MTIRPSDRSWSVAYALASTVGSRVAGLDLVVGSAQLLAELRLALDAHLERLPLELSEREHLPAHLEHRGLRTERERLLGAREPQAESAQLRRRHSRSRTTTGITRSVRVAYSS